MKFDERLLLRSTGKFSFLQWVRVYDEEEMLLENYNHIQEDERRIQIKWQH